MKKIDADVESKIDSSIVIKRVRSWVEKMVIGLNLCPFAKRELNKGNLQFLVSKATTEHQLLMDLENALLALNGNNKNITSLLIHPLIMNDFLMYNQFLNQVDGLLEDLGLIGIYQVASFHPDYQFADAGSTDVTNYTNKSPYPLLHLLPEESVAEAAISYPNIEEIPGRNMELLESYGLEKIKKIYNDI